MKNAIVTLTALVLNAACAIAPTFTPNKGVDAEVGSLPRGYVAPWEPDTEPDRTAEQSLLQIKEYFNETPIWQERRCALDDIFCRAEAMVEDMILARNMAGKARSHFDFDLLRLRNERYLRELDDMIERFPKAREKLEESKKMGLERLEMFEKLRLEVVGPRQETKIVVPAAPKASQILPDKVWNGWMIIPDHGQSIALIFPDRLRPVGHFVDDLAEDEYLILVGKEITRAGEIEFRVPGKVGAAMHRVVISNDRIKVYSKHFRENHCELRLTSRFVRNYKIEDVEGPLYKAFVCPVGPTLFGDQGCIENDP